MKKHLLSLITLSAFIGLSASAQAQDITVEFDPANESQLTEISTFTMKSNHKMTVDWPESARIYRNGVDTNASIGVKLSKDGLTATFTVTPQQTKDGTYTFKNLDWSVSWGDEADVPDCHLIYYIGEPQEHDPVLYSSPYDGSTISSLSEVLLSFENVNTIEINPEKAVYMTNGTEKFPYCLVNMSSGYDKQVLAEPAEEGVMFSDGGKYQLVVEEGALILNGKDYGCALHFTIPVNLEIVATEPAEGIVTIEQLEKINLMFNYNITSITSYMVQALQLYRLDENDNRQESVAGYTVEIDKADAKTIHLIADGDVEIEEPGTYSLNIPPTLFVSDGTKNLAAALHFVVTSLDGIENAFRAEVKSFNVYSASGACLIKDGNAAALKSLAPGIYIINGKNMIIK